MWRSAPTGKSGWRLRMASPSWIPFNCRATRYRRRCTSNSSSPIAAPTTRGPACGCPPLVRDLQIDYTALSLVAPEKNTLPDHARRPRCRVAGRRHPAPGVLYRSRARRLPVPRHCEQQQRRVERGRRDTGILDRAGVLPDALVPGARRGLGPWSGVGGLSRPRPPGRTPVPATPRRTRQRAHTHRAGAARHAASELSRIAAAIPDRAVPAAGSPGRGERATGWCD